MSSRAPGKGQRHVRVTPELIEQFMVEHTDLPDDARLLEITRTDKAVKTGTYTFVFESEAWDEQLEAEYIPLLSPRFVDDDDEDAEYECIVCGEPIDNPGEHHREAHPKLPPPRGKYGDLW